jgi:hypothetical protein
MKKILLCPVLLAALAAAQPENPLLRSQSPDALMVAQGEKLSLFCETTDPFSYCQWQSKEVCSSHSIDPTRSRPPF